MMDGVYGDKSLMNLGDLSPLILMYKKYEQMTDGKKRLFHERYQITEKEIQMLFSKKLELEGYAEILY